MTADTSLEARRLKSWRQTPETRIPTPEEAARFIQVAGVVTLYPVSPEIPNLFHAYVGDPNAKTSPKWDSPSGHVYTWRWTLGRAEAGFYTPIVRGRSTFVAWDLLPAILRLRMESRMPDELYDLGDLSDNAYRITQVLEDAGGVLSTGDLRTGAGFPTGKEHRAAFGKAIDELDTRLLLAKIFTREHDDLNHALVRVTYREQVDEAESMRWDAAMEQFLVRYLSSAVYAAPSVLARHLKLPAADVVAGLERLTDEGRATMETIAGQKSAVYVWA